MQKGAAVNLPRADEREKTATTKSRVGERTDALGWMMFCTRGDGDEEGMSTRTGDRSTGDVRPRGKTKLSSEREMRLEIVELRKRLEDARMSSEQQAVMLREGDHRIRNSLQVIAGLMNGQARTKSSASVRAALITAANRIRSLAIVHEALQRAGGANIVDLGAALEAMCGSLRAMAESKGAVEISVQLQSVDVPSVVARCLVLAVNELVHNSLRHAFTVRGTGTICVSLAKTAERLTVRVADDGAGLPADFRMGGGYGMKLVGMMVRQVGGAIFVEHAPGAVFTIHVPRDHRLLAQD